MTRALVLVALLLAPLAPAADAQTTLVVTGYGGRWSEVMKKVLVEPFEKKHNVKVDIVTGITTEWVAKMLAARVKLGHWARTQRIFRSRRITRMQIKQRGFGVEHLKCLLRVLFPVGGEVQVAVRH